MSETSTYPLTPDGVTAALRTLDVESWEIADKLWSAGIKGTPMDECRCALAAYLYRLIPDAERVHVEAEDVRVIGWIPGQFGLDGVPFSQSFPLPDGAQDFVQEFDKSVYPDLIEEDSNAAA